MKWKPERLIAALLVLSVVSPAMAGDWKFPVGMTYASGFRDVLDFHEAAIGADADFSFPFGVSFHPYFEFDNGQMIGIDVGLLEIIIIETNFSDSKDFFNLPIGVTYGYIFARDASVAPYVRAGILYNLAGGDFVDGSSPGFIAAIGLQMARRKRVSFGLEAAIDNASVDLKDDLGLFSIPDEEVEPAGFQFGFRVIF